MKHAVELFYEMIESIIQLSNKPITKVLLSCTGGLTTGFFAQRINEVVQLLDLNLKVDVIGYNQLYEVGNKYDIILLAPQISYLHAKVHDVFKEQIILNIPPQIFVKYDVGKIISLITKAQENKKQVENVETQALSYHLDVDDHRQILCLTIFKNKEHVHITYHLYQNGKILIKNEIIKNNISIQDIYDVLDTLILQYPDIEMIGMAIPGIIHDGLLSSSYINDIENNEIEKAFSERYTQKIMMTNDVNAAAVGYYVSQKNIRHLCFYFSQFL
ncbi:MAG: ROK family protein [Thomasclavelia spiroformis]|uniref:ROK family protein n=1 Tax=uncultured Thomasclavelia sp. TaxID=3025759 RepID=UPI002596E454|nr:ROK family protein [uncultured Thomasclavelia sp.]